MESACGSIWRIGRRPKVECDALVSYVFEVEQGKGTPVDGAIAELDQAAGGVLARLASSEEELTGKMLEMTLLHSLPGMAAQRLLLIGAGKREKFGTGDLRRICSRRRCAT